MNLDADQNAPNAPRATTPPDPVATPAPRAAPPATAAPAPGGLTSTLKVAAPLVVLVGVVFAVTFLLQNAPKGDDIGTPPPGELKPASTTWCGASAATGRPRRH